MQISHFSPYVNFFICNGSSVEKLWFLVRFSKRNKSTFLLTYKSQKFEKGNMASQQMNQITTNIMSPSKVWLWIFKWLPNNIFDFSLISRAHCTRLALFIFGNMHFLLISENEFFFLFFFNEEKKRDGMTSFMDFMI